MVVNKNIWNDSSPSRFLSLFSSKISSPGLITIAIVINCSIDSNNTKLISINNLGVVVDECQVDRCGTIDEGTFFLFFSSFFLLSSLSLFFFLFSYLLSSAFKLKLILVTSTNDFIILQDVYGGSPLYILRWNPNNSTFSSQIITTTFITLDIVASPNFMYLIYF